MSDTLVRVEHVSKKFCRNLRRSLWYGACDLGNEVIGRQRNHEILRQNEFWAVDDVNFELKRGECLGLIGSNGAGKTTLLRMLNGLITPDRGRISMRGRVGALIALGAGFNPILSGRENIYINAAVLGFTKGETYRRFDRIVEFSGIGEFLDSPVQHYSSGMLLRLGFAIAAHLEPDILLVDEALAVGDASYVVRSLNRIASLRRNGTGVIFVTHNELQLREAAQHCLLLDRGRVIASGSQDSVWPAYQKSQAATVSDVEDPCFVHDGPIRILSATISPATSATNVCGEPLTITLRCQASMPIEGAGVEIRFWSSSGQIVTSIHSLSQQRSLDLPDGVTEVSVEIPSIALAAGTYRLAGGFRRNGEVLGWSRTLATLELRLPHGTRASEGLVLTPATISVHPITGDA